MKKWKRLAFMWASASTRSNHWLDNMIWHGWELVKWEIIFYHLLGGQVWSVRGGRIIHHERRSILPRCSEGLKHGSISQCHRFPFRGSQLYSTIQTLFGVLDPANVSSKRITVPVNGEVYHILLETCVPYCDPDKRLGCRDARHAEKFLVQSEAL